MAKVKGHERQQKKETQAKNIVEKAHVLMNHVKSPSKVTQFSSLPSEAEDRS